MKSFVEEYGKTIIVAIVVVGLILVATLFATDGKDSILDIFRHLRGPSYEMTTSPSEVTPGEDATFVSAAPFDKFKEVRIDGKILDPDNYTASGEPTKITLKGSYTETLDEGKHTIEIISNDGYAEAEFEIKGDPAILMTGSNFAQKIPSGATSVIFTDTKAPDGAALTDVSEAQDGSIVSWLDGTTYKISTQKSGAKVYANPDSSYMFYMYKNSVCKKLTNIDVTNLDTSQVTTMTSMFGYAGSQANTFTIEGLSGWNTSQVTSMVAMFKNAGQYANTFNIGDLGGWDTSQVTSMSSMFSTTGQNASIWNIGDLSSWDTSQVTNMYCMFYRTGGSASTFSIGDLSGWDTSNVTDMSHMFDVAGNRASTWSIGDLSGWNTSKVTKMTSMFSHAGYKASTWNIGDLSGWDTSKVTDMSYMFENTGYSASGWNIDCSSWNVNNVTSYSDFNSGAQSKVTAPTWVN